MERYYAVRGTKPPQLNKTPVKRNKSRQSAKSGSKSPLRQSYNSLKPVREEKKESARNSQQRKKSHQAMQDTLPSEMSRQAAAGLQRGMSDEVLSDNVSPEPPSQRVQHTIKNQMPRQQHQQQHPQSSSPNLMINLVDEDGGSFDNSHIENDIPDEEEELIPVGNSHVLQ